ncbi:MAG: hypothetical protein KDK55_04190 [Chlamydiia bacterium]|nr:hypothetical protein [Chlamydiia bacterium]
MRKKVLIAEANLETRERLERALVDFINEGGEIFFASTADNGLKIITVEHPQLVFVDKNLVGNDLKKWTQNKGYLIVMLKKDQTPIQSLDYIIKPIDIKKVTEKCQKILGKLTEPAPSFPPI